MFARPVRALIRLRATARCNSTVAPAASADAGEKTAPRRTVPILQEFGDIKIRNARKSKVGPNWVGDLGLGSGGGGGLADKLARRKRQNVGGSTSNDAGLEVVLNADGTPQAPELSIPARTQRSNGDRQSSARGEKRQGGANRGNNTRSQGGDRAARPQERGDRAARPQERGDRTARPQERGDRTARPQRGDSQNQRLRPEKQYSANRSSDRRSKTRDEDRPTPRRPLPLPPVQIQQETARIAVTPSELDRLFANTVTFDPTAIAAVKPGAQNLQNAGVARRVQQTLERRGGDYSRYLPQDLGTSFPEQLGALGLARLHVGRRRGAGLKTRENALGTVQSFVVNRVVENQPPSA